MVTRIRFSFICVVFISFHLCDQLYAKRAIEFVKPVQNLSVEAVQDGKYTNVSDDYKFLKLNISWLPSNNSRRPSSYSVILTGISNRKDASMTECPEGSIFHTINDDKQFNVLLPENNGLADIPDLHIQPSCSYKVQVIANPRSKHTINQQVFYTVPDCVGDICSCFNAKLMLPIPKVNVMQTEDQLIVNWSTTSNTSDVSFYLISIGASLLTLIAVNSLLLTSNVADQNF